MIAERHTIRREITAAAYITEMLRSSRYRIPGGSQHTINLINFRLVSQIETAVLFFYTLQGCPSGAHVFPLLHQQHCRRSRFHVDPAKVWLQGGQRKREMGGRVTNFPGFPIKGRLDTPKTITSRKEAQRSPEELCIVFLSLCLAALEEQLFLPDRCFL